MSHPSIKNLAVNPKEFDADVEVNAMLVVVIANGGSFPVNFPATTLERRVLKVAYARIFMSDGLLDSSLDEKSRIETECSRCGQKTYRYVKNMDASCRPCNVKLGFYVDGQWTRYIDEEAKTYILGYLEYYQEEITTMSEVVLQVEEMDARKFWEDRVEAEKTKKRVPRRNCNAQSRARWNNLYPVVPGTRKSVKKVEPTADPDPDPPATNGVTFLIQGL